MWVVPLVCAACTKVVLLACLQVLLGDIFSDLPEVDNFELHERQLYKSWPQRVTQVRNGGAAAAVPSTALAGLPG